MAGSLGRVINLRHGWVFAQCTFFTIERQPKNLKVYKLAQTTFRFSHVNFHAPQLLVYTTAQSMDELEKLTVGFYRFRRTSERRRTFLRFRRYI
jgi:hypothetical protein